MGYLYNENEHAGRQNLFAYLFLGFVVVVCIHMYVQTEIFQLKCVISTVDGKKYCVRDRTKVTEAANLLAKVVARCKAMVAYMKETHPKDPRVKRLVENFNPLSISETLPTSELTAYSENKGEKLAFCLNKHKHSTNVLIDIDTLTFVAFHELSHIMTESIGHKQDFWENFKFLLQNAKRANIYIPVDFAKKPQEYCGMDINDNPYFDL